MRVNSMVKEIKDYYEQMYKLFPDVPKSDIRKILSHGWKQVYFLNSYGGDLVINNQTFWCYFGYLFKNSISHYIKYAKKMIVRLKVMRKRLGIPWDGYYYFGITDKQWDKIKPNKMGRPKKRFDFGNVMLFKYKDECRLRFDCATHIFRVKLLTYLGERKYMRNFITDQAELIEVKERNKLHDILKTNYDYGIG